MGQRARIMVGSIVGAIAVHIAMVACSGDAGIVGGGRLDASMASGDRADAGDFLDAVAAGDIGKAVDVAGDVIRDAMRATVDSEVRDARAGDNCQCITPRQPTFSLVVNRGRGAEAPAARFSTATMFVTPIPGPGGLQGEASFYVYFNASGHLSDLTRVTVSCFLTASRSGQYLRDRPPPGFTQPSCSFTTEQAGRSPIAPASATFDAPTFPVFTSDRIEMRVSSILGTLPGDAGVITINDVVARLDAPGARLLEEAAPAYRP